MKHFSNACIATLFAAALALSASPAKAWFAWFCPNGALANGVQGPVSRWYLVDASAVPGFWDVAIDTTTKIASLGGVADRFPSMSSGSTVHPLGLGTWEIVLNPSDTGPLYRPGAGQALGVAYRNVRNCSSGGGVNGATIYIDESLPMEDDVTSTDAKFTMRSVLAHELGHVLGMEHEDDFIALMSTFAPFPKHAPGNVNGTELSNGIEGLWATEVGFMGLYHADSSTKRKDPAASPWTHDGEGRNELIYPGGTVISRCHGTEASVTYTTANLGLVDTGDVPVRIVLSENLIITRSDFLARDTLTSRSVGNSSVVTKTFTVPDVRAGTYYVGVVLDQGSTITEGDEHNNATRTGLRIKIAPECF